MSRFDTDGDGYYDHEERRQLSEAMREADRYRDGGSRRRYDDDDEDIIEFFLPKILIGAVILFVLIGGAYFGAGTLDDWFGWNLVGWLNDVLPEFLRRE